MSLQHQKLWIREELFKWLWSKVITQKNLIKIEDKEKS